MIGVQRVSRKSKYCRVFFTRQPKTYSTNIQTAEAVEYPEIQDVSGRGRFRTQQKQYFDKIKALNTIEEKLFALNLPKFWGWPAFILKEGVLPYNPLPLTQFITRSVISENNNLPLFKDDKTARAFLAEIKQELEKVILFECTVKRFRHEVETKFYEDEAQAPYLSNVDICNIKTRHLIKQLNSVFVRVLAPHYPHLLSAHVDFEPRLEAFWRVGGFHQTKQDRKLREEKKWPEMMMDDPIDRFFMYYGEPMVQLRHKLPLPTLPTIRTEHLSSQQTGEKQPEVMQIGSSENTESSRPEQSPAPQLKKPDTELLVAGESQVCTDTKETSQFYPWQEYRYSPDLYLGVARERLHGAVVPGFWPDDPLRFGLVSFHSGLHLFDRPDHYGAQDAKEALHAQALMASYAWTYGQACYQGFTTYHDVTYPFTTQTVITDGKMFSFYQYQLNTITMHTDLNVASNPLLNECYATPPMELYHKLGVDGVEGWNDEALLNLLAIYTNVPATRESVDLCPYLNPQERLVSQIAEDERRVWLHDEYRRYVSHRPRPFLPPEIFDWERIYKIENQRRLIDARKRFFEKFEDPINDRKLCEHPPPYIPKKFRAKVRTTEQKLCDGNTFYPDVLPTYPEIV